MKTRALLGLTALLACAPRPDEGGFMLPAPARLQQALSKVTGLEAGATLVPKGGAPLLEVPLSRADDGLSFSGFLAADPGEYVLEVVFRGQPIGGGALGFLGRLSSDGFTVSQGAVTTPSFSRPLDTIGSSADHGDDDGDGLGLLDEWLTGSDPALSDTDGDGLPDGQDCDPTLRDRAFSIAAGGDLLDCDGDGVGRADPPFGPVGLDCDDRDGAIRPGAEDLCTDAVDQDCNPATCPTDDRDPPVFVSVAPAEGAALGCHSPLFATVTDNSTVSAVVADLPPDGNTPRTLFFRGLGGGQYRSSPLQQVLFNQADPSASFPVRYVATDPSGLKAERRVTYRLDLVPPTITRFTPNDLAGLTGPIPFEVEAASPRGVAQVELLAIPRSGAGVYRLADAVVLARQSGATLSANVDPAAFPAGEVLLVPKVIDPVGNRLQPALSTSPVPELGQLYVYSDYSCLEALQIPKIPVRVYTPANSPYRPTTMREHLDEARALAAQADPNAAFVKVIGFGLRPDGKIDLSDASSFSKRWEYGFYNPTTQRWITVSWFTPAFASSNPVVDLDAGNVVEELPLIDGPGLLDSDQLASAYAGIAGCGTLTGNDDDTIIYHRTDEAGGDEVYVSAMDLSWVGTPHLPITTIANCN